MMAGNYEDLRTSLYKNEQIRKVQQQQIIHLKGNMRVFCRVKPSAGGSAQESGADSMLLASMLDQSQQDTISFPQLIQDTKFDKGKVQHQTLELSVRTGGANVYNFDHVFLPDSAQSEIFAEIKPFVQSAMDGENTCIFAYGQTGSGKTYTMEGPDSTQLYDERSNKVYQESGILPRIAVFIQSEIDRYRTMFAKSLSIEVSALEIYCENVRDLLWERDPGVEPSKERFVEIKTAGNKIQCIG
jgi:kinesin family protein C1